MTAVPIDSSMETAIRGAACPEDVFGELAGDADAKRVALRHAYQALARVLHPDKNVGPDADKARALFIRVTELRPQAEAKIDAGTYGQRHVAPPAPPPPPAALLAPALLEPPPPPPAPHAVTTTLPPTQAGQTQVFAPAVV